MQIDLSALPDDAATLQLMLRTVVLQQGEIAAENDKLRLLIQRLTRHQFGRRSEQLTPDQLQLALEELEQTIAANQAGQDAAAAAAGLTRKPRAEAPARNHGALPAHLPRYEVVIDVENHACPCCGHALHPIGELTTEQLDMVPSQLRVRVTRRPRYACHGCESAIVVAPAPDRPIDGGMPTEALIAHVVVSKFADSLPLYRQVQMLERQGIKLDRSTLANWVGRACWWLTPLYELMLGTVLAAPKVFADDTTLPVLDPGRGRTKTGRLWCYAVDDRPWRGPGHPMAAYVYSDDRKNERPAGHLAKFRGVLQVDGYNGFKALADARADASVTLAFCWSHLRRYFYDEYVSTKSPLAAEVLVRVRALYAIEAEIRGHPAEHRRAVRQERSRPIVEALHGWLQDQVKRVSGASDLAIAMRYAIRHWPGLVVFLDDGRVEMGRVDDWRGGCRSRGVAVSGGFRLMPVPHCRRTVTPFPVAARQTGHADFPHPAFSRPVRPSLSAGRRAAAGRYRGRVSHKDTRPGSGGTRRLVVPFAASTSGELAAQCMRG